MLSNLKNHFERAIISGLIVLVLSASIVSWGKILSEKNHPKDAQRVVELEANQASKQLKKGVMVFSGLMIVVAEYFQLKDDK